MEICFHSTWPHLAEEMSVWAGGGRNFSIFGFHWKNQRSCSSKREKCPHFDCQGNVACALILCRRSIVRQRAPSIQTAMQCGYCCCVAQYLLPLHLKKMSEIEWKATSFPPQTMSSECWFFSRIFAWWIHLFCLSVERQHLKKKKIRASAARWCGTNDRRCRGRVRFYRVGSRADKLPWRPITSCCTPTVQDSCSRFQGPSKKKKQFH